MKSEENPFEGLSVQDVISDDLLPDLGEPKDDAPEKDEVDDEPEPPQDEPTNKPEDEPTDKPEPTDEPDEGNKDESDDESIVNELKQKYGFDFEEKQFEESVDGIYELSLAAAEKLAENQINDFFKQMPDVAEFAEYRMNGGDPGKFFETMNQTKDYSQVSITEDDTATQRHIVEELLKRQGFDDESRGAMLETLSKSGAMFDQAKAALPILSKLSAKDKQSLIEQQKQQAIQMEEQRKKELNEIQGIVKTGNFKGIQVPEAEKNKFSQWLFQPGKDGKTGRNSAREQMTLEDKLALEYLVYKGFKLDDLIQKRVANAKAKDLKSLLKDKQGSRMRNDAGERKTFNIPDVTDLFG